MPRHRPIVLTLRWGYQDESLQKWGPEGGGQSSRRADSSRKTPASKQPEMRGVGGSKPCLPP